MADQSKTTSRGAVVRQRRATLNNDRFWRDNNVERNLGRLPGETVVIGDIHGSWYTLTKLIERLGGGPDGQIPEGITIVSVGDIHDKGRHSTRVLRWAMEKTLAGKLVVVDSNHGRALIRRIHNTSGQAKTSVERTYRELLAEPDADTLLPRVLEYLSKTPVFARIAGGPTGEIVVAHAAATPRLLGSPKLRPSEVRFHMLAREFQWHGDAVCVVGHVRTTEPLRVPGAGGSKGSLLRIDTGCAEPAGKLTAWLAATDTFVSVDVDPRDLSGHAIEDLIDDCDTEE